MNNKETLNLSVYKVYFDEILHGIKKTEYRDMNNDYWIDKLVDKSHYKGMTDGEIREALKAGKELHWNRNYKKARFFCGLQNFVIEIKDINVYEGHSMFAIRLGKITERQL